MRILGIDPGLDTGYALIEDGALTCAGLGDPRDQNIPWPDRAVIECPRIYPHGGKGDPNGLIKLAVMVGEYKGFYGLAAELVFPYQWKGQLPKSVTEKRVRARFPFVDQFLAGVAPSKKHNVLDAAGIAMWFWCNRGH